MGKALKKGPFGPCFPHVFQYATFCYLAVRRKRLPFLRFPCVCPEPVLTNDRFLRHAFICINSKARPFSVFRFPAGCRPRGPKHWSERISFARPFYTNCFGQRSFYQDRLWTNTRKALKKRDPCGFAYSPHGFRWLPVPNAGHRFDQREESPFIYKMDHFTKTGSGQT